jgi:hypothetical protein
MQAIAERLTQEQVNLVADRWLRKLEASSVYVGVTDRPKAVAGEGFEVAATLEYTPLEGGPSKRWLGTKGGEVWEGDIYPSGKIEVLGRLPVGGLQT